MATVKTVTKKKTAVKKETVKKAKKPTLRELAKKYSENEKIEYFNLAEIVSLIYEKESWKDWGFVSFEDFGEKELNRSYRTMRNLSVAGDVIRRTKLPIKEASKVDKSVFTNIASYAEAEKLVKDQVTDLINEVKDLPFEKAKEVIKSKRIQDAPTTEIVKVQLKFTQEQYEAVKDNIKEAQEVFNTGDNISLAIEHVLLVWGANRLPEQENQVMQFVKEKGLDKAPTKSKVKRKEPSHKGKK